MKNKSRRCSTGHGTGLIGARRISPVRRMRGVTGLSNPEKPRTVQRKRFIKKHGRKAWEKIA